MPITIDKEKKHTGMIRFLCDEKISKTITGNGVAGDDRIVWDRRFKDQIEEAKKQFQELIKLGYLAFLVKSDGKKSDRQIFKFDPDLEEVIMLPAIVGG